MKFAEPKHCALRDHPQPSVPDRIIYVANFAIRRATVGDEDQIASMMAELWPDGSFKEHCQDAEELVRTGMCGTLPAAIFVATNEAGRLMGFLQAGLRSHADGCDPVGPVGFIEGWYVREGFRGRGVGRRLVETAEEWACRQGCSEMASDALLDNQESLRAHSALGFEVVDRCVHFRKRL